MNLFEECNCVYDGFLIYTFSNARNMWNESTTIKIVPVTFIVLSMMIMGYVLPICRG